ncbi:MAG: asparagine synthase C-terminal domain-containing protein [Thermoplasmata archaeon]
MMDAEGLLKPLRISMKACVAGQSSVAVAYSGGVDSALVERIARESTRTVCYTCAVRGSHDHFRAPLSAEESGVELRMIVLERDRLSALVSKACAALDTEDPLRVAYSLPTMCVIDGCSQDVVLVGSGADELFGGYAKYLVDEDPGTSMGRDLDKMLAETELLAGYARSVGKRLEAPFVAPKVVSFAKSLPIQRKLGSGNRKIVLREAARSLGVLSHDSPKKAAQYSSGVMKEMRALAKESGKGLREWTSGLAAEGRRIP